jgi:opacity protein-like surface antigen
MRMRHPIIFLSTLFFIGISSSALADEGDSKCPPGSWFCADVDNPEGTSGDKPPEGGKGELKTTPEVAGDGDSGKKSTTVTTTDKKGHKTTIIVNADSDPNDVEIERKHHRRVRPAPPRYEAPPPRPYRRRRHRRAEWGFNMHLQGAMMGSQRNRNQDSDSGMGGLGFALRARPNGYFALDFGLDFMNGRDYQGYKRSEVPFSINALIFVNPRNKLQFYMLGGLNWSSANVDKGDGAEAKYSYFGLQMGAGLEFRVSKTVALNFDVIGFVRGRTDDGARSSPEFVDPNTGRQTNTSGGGLMRGGLTFYW